MKKRAEGFRGLRLSQGDREQLRRLERRGGHGLLRWRRIRMLLLLDRGWNLGESAEAVGTYRREARRVVHRYVQGGLEAALSDEPRRKMDKKLDASQEAALVAMVCGPPPLGRTRWTLRLLAAEARRRRLVREISYETVRRTLHGQQIKPWREKNVVRAVHRHSIRRADAGAVGALSQAL